MRLKYKFQGLHPLILGIVTIQIFIYFIVHPSTFVILNLLLLLIFTNQQQIQDRIFSQIKKICLRLNQITGKINFVKDGKNIKAIILSLFFIFYKGFTTYLIGFNIFCLFVNKINLSEEIKIWLKLLQKNGQTTLSSVIQNMSLLKKGLYLMILIYWIVFGNDSLSLSIVLSVITFNKQEQILRFINNLEPITIFSDPFKEYKKFCLLKFQQGQLPLTTKIGTLAIGIPMCFSISNIISGLTGLAILCLLIMQISGIAVFGAFMFLAYCCVIRFQKIQDQNSDKLTQKQNQNVLKLLNQRFDVEDIISKLTFPMQTKKRQLIREKCESLKRPPRPFPSAKQSTKSNPGKKKLPLFNYEAKKEQFRKYQTLLVIGKQKAKKEKLIDFLVNDLDGQRMQDNWRFTMDFSNRNNPEEHEIYYINDVLNQFNIKIIDLPNISQSKQLQQIFAQNFINKVLGIADCLEQIQQIETLLTKTIEKLKNKDAIIPIFISLSQDDNLKYQNLQMLGDKFQKCIFDLSDLNTPKNQVKDKSIWRKNLELFRQIKDRISKSKNLPINTRFSDQKIQELNGCFDEIQNLSKQIFQNFAKLFQAGQQRSQVQKHKSKIIQDPTFKVPKLKTEYIQRDLGQSYQRCSKCQVNCCQYCVWPPGQKLSKCTYFNNGQNCPKCPGKCPRQDHQRSNKSVQKIFTEFFQYELDEPLKKIYDRETDGKTLYRQVLSYILKKFEQSQARVIQQIDNIIKARKKIDEIVCDKSSYSEFEFFQQLKRKEEEIKKQGYEQRIQKLNHILSLKSQFKTYNSEAIKRTFKMK